MLAIVRLEPAFAPLTPTRVPCTYRLAGLGVTEAAICTGVEPGPAEKVVCRLVRSNRHIASPNRWVHDDCHRRRGIWMFNSSRCERHRISTLVRVQSMSEMRPAKRITV